MSDPLTEKIIGACIEVHRELGPGLLESIYEEALCHELQLRGMRCSRQLSIDVRYKGIVIKGQRLDLLVEDEVILELKSVTDLPEVGNRADALVSESHWFEAWINCQFRREETYRWDQTDLSVISVPSVANN